MIFLFLRGLRELVLIRKRENITTKEEKDTKKQVGGEYGFHADLQTTEP